MRKNYPGYLSVCAAGLLFMTLFVASCKKDNKTPTPVVTAKAIASIGLYEVDTNIVSSAKDTINYKRIFIPITKVGTQTVQFYSVFDTGSTGMTIGAAGLLPKSMITSTGIKIPAGQDSTTVNGITVTNQTAIMAYGNSQSEIQEFGNLAYATIFIGTQQDGITTARIPIFLYYKIVDVTTGVTTYDHSNDVFGVGPGVSYASNLIKSPLSYFKTGTNVTNGFKLAQLPKSGFSIGGTFVSDLLTIGLVPDDLAASSGFVMHPLQYYSQGGYSPDLPVTVTYVNFNGTSKNLAATLLLDTGTPAISTIADPTAASNIAQLPVGTNITISTSAGFSYTYTSKKSTYITDVVKPTFTGDPRTIFGLDFFTDNEYLLDYTDHKIGLKNN